MSRWDAEIDRRLAEAGLDPVRQAEISRELAQHLDDRYAELVSSGVADEEAVWRTLDELKESDRMTHELTRVERVPTSSVVAGDTRRQPFLAGVSQDVRYALRSLRASRSFTAVAVLTLALGIGATTAIFSVVDAMLIRPLTYDPDGRLVRVFRTRTERGTSQKGPVAETLDLTPSIATFKEWQVRRDIFDAMAAFKEREVTLLDASPVERVWAMAVTPEFFRLFDTSPTLGRLFDESDTDEPVTVISDGCWQRRFGGDPSIVGRTIRTVDGAKTVVGILPARFPYSSETDFWIPLAPNKTMMTRDGWGGTLYARLSADITLEQAREGMASYRRERRSESMLSVVEGAGVEAVHEWNVKASRQMLFTLLAAVSCILLIACVNVASLLLARGSGRSREVAIRASLGAGRLRLAQQFLTESIVLAMLGGVAGVVLAWWLLNALLPILPVNVPSENPPALDLRVLGFSFLVSCLTGVLFGLLPALRLSRADLVTDTKPSGLSTTYFGWRTGSALVVVEVALALMLMVGAGLMLRSFHRLLSVDSGFQSEHVIVIEVSPVLLDETAATTAGRSRIFYSQIIERIAGLPGVSAVGAIDTLPFWSTSHTSADLETTSTPINVSPRNILPGYFAAMGVPIKLGRDFTQQDREHAPCVAIVNETLVRGAALADPLGRRIRLRTRSTEWCEIVGVVADVRHRSLERQPLAELYVSALQTGEPELVIVARAAQPVAVAALARAQTKGLTEPALVQRIRPFDTFVAASTAQRRRRAALLTILGGLGVLLAAVGIFGLTSYAVARRTREIGVRVALGATPRRVLGVIVGSFAPAIATGVALGLLGAWAATRTIAQFLFGVTPTDPPTLIAAAGLLASVALLATYAPARRALRVDPVVALRAE